MVLISLILILALGSIKYGLLSLVPNLFPAILVFGLWLYLQGQVGLAVAVVAAISSAVVVGDNVIRHKKAMKDFLDYIQKSPDYDTVIIRASMEKGDGMSISYKIK